MLLLVEPCFPNKAYAGVLTPTTSECDFTWKYGLYRGNQIKVRMRLPMQETWVQFLCREDPLEEEMATHSSILAWEIQWIEEPGGLQSMGLQIIGYD